VQRIDVDGVPVFTAPGPDRVTAALIVGVGVRDETFATLGITHLVEHLVMGTLPKSHLECNAMVDVESTTFFATGRADRVAGFLAAVCEAIADPPTDRIALETGVLQAEGCAGAHPTAAVLWGARFGLAGAGLAVAGGGVPDALTEDQVRQHVRRWFVRGNAALAWHGPAPEGLRLPLPDGPRPVRTVPEARPQSAPVWTTGPTAGVGLLVRSPRATNTPLNIALDVLQERMRDLARHQRGLSYHCDAVVLDVGPGSRESALVVDAREGQEAEVARLLWEQYADLAEHGPTVAELAHSVEGCAEHAAGGDDAVAADLGRAAFAELFGLPFRPADEVLAEWRAVTPDAAAAAVRETLPAAILAAPEGVQLTGLAGGIDRRPLCNQVPVLPAGTRFGPPLRARLRRRGRVQLVVGEEALGHVDGDGDVHVLPWSEVEAVVPASDGRGMLVVGRNLCWFDVHEELYGRRAVAAVRGRLPQELWPATATVTADADPVPVPA
jgi:hypothetical protein